MRPLHRSWPWRFYCCPRSSLEPQAHFPSKGNWLIRGLTGDLFTVFYTLTGVLRSHCSLTTRHLAESLFGVTAATPAQLLYLLGRKQRLQGPKWAFNFCLMTVFSSVMSCMCLDASLGVLQLPPAPVAYVRAFCSFVTQMVLCVNKPNPIETDWFETRFWPHPALEAAIRFCLKDDLSRSSHAAQIRTRCDFWISIPYNNTLARWDRQDSQNQSKLFGLWPRCLPASPLLRLHVNSLFQFVLFVRLFCTCRTGRYRDQFTLDSDTGCV